MGHLIFDHTKPLDKYLVFIHVNYVSILFKNVQCPFPSFFIRVNNFALLDLKHELYAKKALPPIGDIQTPGIEHLVQVMRILMLEMFDNMNNMCGLHTDIFHWISRSRKIGADTGDL